MTFDRKRLSALVNVAAYIFAACMGVWLANAACFISDPTRSAAFVVLALVLLAVALVPFPSLRELPFRIVSVIGLLVVISFVQALAQPLFPGIDYSGPESIQSYLFDVYLSANEPFGPCFAPDSYLRR
jgi:hypothetical protein